MGKYGQIFCIKIFIFNLVFCCLPVFGQILVTDGDTIRNKGEKIRLEGIDAPEIKQQCKKPFLKISAIIGFEFNKDYSCGVMAKKNW